MIQVDIVTPVKKLVEGAKADWVKIPGIRGELEILPGHRELLTLLTTGVLSFPHQGKERKFAISHGFAEVRNNRILVLAETAEESTGVDKARAALAQKRAEEKLVQGVLDEHDFRKQQLKLQRAVTRQTILQS
ncbi:MAG: ATP synthase F1 subunit epsilon [Proteobacteria bacterium]|nr:ATP synthase F1 subunit epsilon [Pseudomonadota bacterium]NDC25565.1 ATP synthase F1 subunit epsilon [Pseudomonadota bacterium]NDD05431.1 ATP synthase F1 subunit epsilon [Pseudomonadota bacterium]NDG27918.1 ATP synthase F1 subunit epsilon [Pseudomonadota bacterium]